MGRNKLRDIGRKRRVEGENNGKSVFEFFKIVGWMHLKVFKFLGECLNRMNVKRV